CGGRKVGGVVVPFGLRWCQIGRAALQDHIVSRIAVAEKGKSFHGDEMPGAVQELADQAVAHANVAGRLGGPGSPWLPWEKPDAPEEASLGADVTGAPAGISVQGLAVSQSARSAARDAIDQDDIGDDVVIDMIADVVLHGRIAIDARANLGIDFVPGSAHLGIEVAAQRAEVFVQIFGAALPAPFDALTHWWSIRAALGQLAAVAFRLLPGA